MKYNKNSDKTVAETGNDTRDAALITNDNDVDTWPGASEAGDTEKGGPLEAGSGNKADNLQTAVYREGIRVLNILSGMYPKENMDIYKKTGRALEELGNFYYNIGFAGEQSCGKSTVVNSLLQYPLMPTCNLTTTCTVVRLIYSDKIRVIATDDDTGKRIFDLDCTDISEKKFNKLKEYVCLAMPVLIIDNINYFTDKDIYDRDTQLTFEDIDMSRENPREVALLVLVLLSVYIGQNDLEMTEQKKRVIAKREEIMRYFGIPKSTVNYSVLVQWNCDLLRSGLMITDLPGLGASAEEKEVDGKILKSHDDITKEAIQESDAMVFLEDDTVKNVGTAALREMLSSSRLKEVVNKGERIIPVLNKADRLNGAQMITSQQKFSDLLLGANVKKQISDIVPYSAIYGEYTYDDINMNRRLFFKTAEAKAMHSMGRKMNMPDEAIMDNLMSSLKEKYEKSGIQELKDFFRTVYVERGKYNKAVTAVFAVRNLAIQVISPLQSRAEAYEILGDATEEAVNDITGALKKAAMDPIGYYTGEVTEKIGQVTAQTQPVVEAMLESTAPIYQIAFEKALEDYKKRLLDIVGKFNLTWHGSGLKAQINVTGSVNRSIYFDLMGEMEKFPVDVVAINSQYEKILGFVDGQIDQIYQKAIDGMEKLKKGLNDSIGQSIENVRKKSEMNQEVVIAMDNMGGELLSFIDKQLLAMNRNLDMQREGIGDAGNAVVAQVMKQNTDMVNSFTGAIKDSVKDFIGKGFWFSSREYLMIDGSNGLKKKISGLALTGDEKENMDTNIRSVGSMEIVNKLNMWINQAGEITDIYTDLALQIELLMDHTAMELAGTAGSSKDAYEKLMEEIARLKKEFGRFQKKIQRQFDEALSYFRETDSGILNMQGNVIRDIW